MSRIYLYLIFYALLLCFVRFSDVNAATTIPQFALLADPAAFPGDMYVHESVMARTTVMYRILKVFGSLASNGYSIFFIYCAVGILHIYFIWKIAELLHPELRDHFVGLICILLFMYDSPVLHGAYSELVTVHSFRQTVLNMPVIAASIYFFLKDRIMLAIFLVAFAAMPIHYRSSWVLVIIYMAYMFVSRRFKLKKIAFGFLLVLVGLLVIYSYYHGLGSGFKSHDQKIEIFRMIIDRYKDEGSPFLNPPHDFLKLTLIISAALYFTRFLSNKEHTAKLYLFYAIPVIIFIFGGIYTSYLYERFPSIELMSLGFPQLVSYPIIISYVLIGGGVLRIIALGQPRPWKKIIFVVFLFLFAYFPHLKISSLLIYLLCIFIGWFATFRLPGLLRHMKLNHLAAWLYISIVLFLSCKASVRLVQAHRMDSNIFPLMTSGFEKDFYDCQLWARRETKKNSVFFTFRTVSTGIQTADNIFRKYSGRTCFLGDYANIMHDYDLIQEHIKRDNFRSAFEDLIKKGGASQIKTLVGSSNWQIDFLVLPHIYTIGEKPVYSNASYNIYDVRSWFNETDRMA